MGETCFCAGGGVEVVVDAGWTGAGGRGEVGVFCLGFCYLFIYDYMFLILDQRGVQMGEHNPAFFFGGGWDRRGAGGR